jgi:putative FmdB family regulatory protein
MTQKIGLFNGLSKELEKMPTYEYECLKCKSRFEIFQRMTDQPIKCCFKCNGKMRRLIGTGGGLIFKGSGFYITDYKKNQNPPSSTSTKQNKSDSIKNPSQEKTATKSNQQDTKKAS